MYTFSSRIRYSEIDADGFLRITAMIDYLQDCSTFHSEEVGYGAFRLFSEGYAWVVNAWQIEINRLPRLGDNVILGTIPYEIRGSMGLRNFFMDTAEGERLVTANSVWSYLNLTKGVMERVPQEMKDAFGTEEKLEMNYLSRKLPFPTEGTIEDAAPIEIRRENLDTNRHVNNGQFIRLALDAAFDPLPPIRRIRAEYKKQAHLGDVLYPRIHRAAGPEETVTIALPDANGDLCCTVEATLTGGGSH